ncbi:MAG: hypothetical protein A3E01_19735 [Gammaproteobacteria bacterium RIFCSPHIGHO2_12_FULL_63_22]|nr:MAG: hypothetical protein A3E01_19735 [Gammaproteobacteria bacterium RIFCSPHIGHO2_12_FULL_63_22]
MAGIGNGITVMCSQSDSPEACVELFFNDLALVELVDVQPDSAIAAQSRLQASKRPPLEMVIGNAPVGDDESLAAPSRGAGSEYARC